MKKTADGKAERVLSIYARLREGQIIHKKEESNKYDVAQRTIQRDISDIQCFLQTQSYDTGEVQEIVFDRSKGGYRLETKIRKCLDAREILAICKILLESRALIREEMIPIILKLMDSCNDEEKKKRLKQYVGNEMHHYEELHHGKKMLECLELLEAAVKQQRYIEIRYMKLKDPAPINRKLKPVGVMFSEFYFYLTAYIEDIDKEKKFQNPNDIFPTIYRIDRIEEVTVLEEHFTVPYAERFEEGEFRKRIQFMYGGRLQKIRFQYTGLDIDAVLDRLPTAIIESEKEGKYIIKAEVFGTGIDMWLRSQGETVKIMR